MELFYSHQVEDGFMRLSVEESAHCCRVLRHHVGDLIQVIDGQGNMYDCRLTCDDPRATEGEVEEVHEGWGLHPYHLTMAVCPTKNIDRFEWFAEKSVELGVDCIQPVIGEHSERKVIKTERIRSIVLSATKQSLKGALPEVNDCMSVKEFIRSTSNNSEALKLIAHCMETDNQRFGIHELLGAYKGQEIIILIGPEGDFSPAEVQEAIEAGYKPVHLGPSRLRTETAAVTAVAAVYFNYL